VNSVVIDSFLYLQASAVTHISPSNQTNKKPSKANYATKGFTQPLVNCTQYDLAKASHLFISVMKI